MITKSDLKRIQDNRDLFLHNVFLFKSHRELILNEPRMALATVPYSHASIGERVVLGAYVDWWTNHQSTFIKAEDKDDWLICEFMGFPDMDISACMGVNANGQTTRLGLHPYAEALKSLAKTNSRVKSQWGEIEPYTLDEIVKKLKAVS